MPEQHNINNEFNRTVGRIEGKLDSILDNQREFHEKHEKLDQKVDGVEGRIGKVENKLNWYSGAVAAAFTILTFFGDQIRALFRAV